jgi:hypothetical protein
VALAAFTLVFYWGVTETIGTDVWVSNNQDGASFAWNLWNFSHSLSHGHDPFVTQDLFYPVGAPLGFQTYTPLLGLLAWPLIALFGLVDTYTIMTLAGPVLSGVFTYLLAHHLTRNQWAALFAGAAYAMLPDTAYRMVGHLNLVQMWVLPLGLLALLRFYEAPQRRTAALLGAAFGVSVLVESTFTVFLVFATVVVALVNPRTTFRGSLLKPLSGAVAIALVVASPLLMAMARDVKNGQLDPIPGWGEAQHENADAISYLLPSQHNPLTGHWLMEQQIRYAAGEKFTFIAWTVTALAIASLFLWRSRWKRTIAVAAAAFFVLSLGPFLKVAGWHGSAFTYLGASFSVPLPYFALHFLPILNGIRIPARFALMTDLLLILMAAGALAALLARLQANSAQRRAVPAVALAALCLVTLESLPGAVPPHHRATIPTPYSAIQKDPGNAAVLDLPLQWRDGFGHIGDGTVLRDHTVFLYYATEHGKPLANGMTARYPDKDEAALQQIPVYSQVLTLQHDADSQPVTFGPQDLRNLGIGYVVGHRDLGQADVFSYMANLHMPVLADDGNTIVWKVPATS